MWKQQQVVLQGPLSFHCQWRGAVRGTDTVLRMLFFLQLLMVSLPESANSCSSWTSRAKNITGAILHLYLFLGKIQSEDKINVNYLTSYSAITSLLSCTVICNLDVLFLQTNVFFILVFCFVLFCFYYFCINIWCQ